MYVLEPTFHHTIWGGNRLVNTFGAQANGLGHLYSLRSTDRDSNIILSGEFVGQRLFDVIGVYPLSIALVDARADLSIQVHPGGNQAKLESYYFIDAPDSGHIYNGFDCPVENIRAAAEAGTIVSYIGKTRIQNGDYIHIEPYTVHALSAGSFVYEIEQGEENTYRLFDYNRKEADGSSRDLHVEQAIIVLDISRKAKAYKYQPGSSIIEKTFMTRLLTDIIDYKNNSTTYECLTLLSGCASIGGISMKTGMTVVLEPGEILEQLEIDKCMIARSLI